MSGFWSLLTTASMWGFMAALGAGAILLVWWLIRNASSTSDDEDDEIYWKARSGAYRVAAAVVLSLIALMGSCSMEEAEKKKIVEAKKEEERQANLRESRAKDMTAARKMGVSLDQYLRGKEASLGANIACKMQAASMAVWDVSNNWGGGYDWSIRGDSIKIVANDLKMTNGFGGGRAVNYNCNYDLKSKVAVITSIH